MSENSKSGHIKPNEKVFFSTGDVAVVASNIHAANIEYEALFTNLGTQIFVSVTNTNTPSDKFAVALQYITDAIVAFEQNFPGNSKLACEKGCHHCCHFPIETSQQVVDAIASHLTSTLDQADLEILKIKLAANINARSAPLFRAACPFLDNQHACSIYHKRPLACRWFSSNNASNCAQSVIDGRSIQQHPIHTRIYQAATTALLADQKEQTGSDQQLAFIPAIAKALQTL
jgi:Fe-S-cluster containining protein